MQKYIAISIFSLFFVFNPLQAESQSDVQSLGKPAVKEIKTIPITLEFAKKPDEITWGLMQRKSLPKDHGMLFIYPRPLQVNFWSFNCLMDLSVAFMDQDHVIRDIRDLKAYPEKMDPLRPVKCVRDIDRLYSLNDPVIRFFQEHAVTPSIKPQYVLEMNKQWFQKNGVKQGDIITWDEGSSSGIIIKTNNGS